MAWLFELSEGAVRSWRSYAEREEALAAAAERGLAIPPAAH
jgi:hypothetical protein